MNTTQLTQSKTALFVITTGFETWEFTAPYDILKKAGAITTVAKALDPTKPEDKTKLVIAAEELKVEADVLLEDIKDKIYDMIILPGGHYNARYLGKDTLLIEMLKKHKAEGKLICAICAAPFWVLQENGLAEGEDITGYVHYTDKFKNQKRVHDRVVISHNIITSMGPATSCEFGFAICEIAFGKEKTQEIKEHMLYKGD